ncbi:MAG: hypothetical protein IH969_02305 [Candidatus Krumholzibacteriota bacterium]|nr:hypothetical protein [Candidatus Krumholzibacteriota bacterium]
MIQLAADIEYDLGQVQAVYVRNYIDGPKVAVLSLYGESVRGIIRGMIWYSLELVSLAESHMSGEERSEVLADYLDGVMRPVLSSPAPRLNFTIAELDILIGEVAKQDNFLDALNAAQPLIDEAARVAAEVLAETQEAVDAAVVEIRGRIDDDRLDIAISARELTKAHAAIARDIIYLRHYRMGDAAALDTLFAKEPSLREVVKNQEQPTPEDLRAIEERLLFIIRSLAELRVHLQPALELYWKQHREVDQMQTTYSAALRRARVAVIAWDRGHQRLAAGITEPAEIDLIGIARSASGAAKKAIVR